MRHTSGYAGILFWTGLFSLSLSFSFGHSHQPSLKKKPVKTAPADTLLETLMHSQPAKFDSLLAHPKRYRIQIIYTQIDRDSGNTPHFTQHTYRLNPKEFFYCASLVKIPASALSLEKLNRIHIPGLDKYSRMKIDSAYACESAVIYDSTSENYFPSIAHYIKKAMLVSDNDAYNRLYEFLGQKYFNERLWEMGYTTARITTRFLYACDTLANRHTNPMTFYSAGGDSVYYQPGAYNPKQYSNPYGKVLIGKAYIASNGRMVRRPKDYTFANYLSLHDINRIMISLVFPNSVPEKQRFALTGDDYTFLRKYMSMYPRESDYPHYDPKYYGDSFKKYCIYGACRDTITNESIRIFNHVGQAHGFLADCAYIVDFENKVEFLLSAVIYVNKDGVLNDGKYETTTIGFPFLADLGQLLYEYEKTRVKKHLPDLEEFRLRKP